MAERQIMEENPDKQVVFLMHKNLPKPWIMLRDTIERMVHYFVQYFGLIMEQIEEFLI